MKDKFYTTPESKKVINRIFEVLDETMHKQDVLDVTITFVMRMLISANSQEFKDMLIESINNHWEEKSWLKTNSTLH